MATGQLRMAKAAIGGPQRPFSTPSRPGYSRAGSPIDPAPSPEYTEARWLIGFGEARGRTARRERAALSSRSQREGTVHRTVEGRLAADDPERPAKSPRMDLPVLVSWKEARCVR